MPERYEQRPFAVPPDAVELLLVRHGASMGAPEGEAPELLEGHSNPPLAPSGHEQALRVADRLAALPLCALYVTPLQRTHQTAAPLAERLGLVPTEIADLREVFLGEWEGGELRRRVTDKDPLAAAMFEAGRWDVIPGAEPDDEFRGRVQRAIERIAAAHPDEVVVAVVHGGVIGQAMNIASGARGFAFTGSDNASVSHLVITPYRWIIRCFNDTAHLTDRFSTADEPPPVTGIRPAGVTF
jgi:probable phosphoglycerate mutase